MKFLGFLSNIILWLQTIFGKCPFRAERILTAFFKPFLSEVMVFAKYVCKTGDLQIMSLNDSSC